MAEMLDLAQRRWPEVRDRRQLLIRLAGAGREAIAAEVQTEDRAARRERQLTALARGRELIDVDALLGDAAWR
jgi:hypothetical protein